MKNRRYQGQKSCVEKSEALWFSDGRRKDYKIPSGAVWTQWLSASVSQYKITVENEMKEEKREQSRGKEALSSLHFILRSDRVRGEERWRRGEQR